MKLTFGYIHNSISAYFLLVADSFSHMFSHASSWKQFGLVNSSY